MATSDQALVRPEDGVFWDLVCGDEDWLRAQFDAIIAAEYPSRERPAPPTLPPRHRAHGGPGTRRSWVDGPGPATAEAQLHPPPRQRSPPQR